MPGDFDATLPEEKGLTKVTLTDKRELVYDDLRMHDLFDLVLDVAIDYLELTVLDRFTYQYKTYSTGNHDELRNINNKTHRLMRIELPRVIIYNRN